MGEGKGNRRHFSSQDKARAVRRQVLGGEAASSICEALGIAPNLFSRWQKELFDHGAAAFEVRGRGRKPDAGASRLERENARLRGQLARKDAVIAGVTEDYVRLKKSFGED